MRAFWIQSKSRACGGPRSSGSRAAPADGAFIVQVGQDSLNNDRIVNAAVRRVDNDPDQSGAVLIV
jgi:hypothetical protein